MPEVYRSPWFDLEGYLACTVKYEDGSKKTILWHREVMERRLGRPLLSSELVHHKDEDKRNNDPDNLEVTNRVKHGQHHAVRQTVRLVCVQCGAEFERQASAERHFRKQAKTGPFCGKRCVGIWSRNHQIASGQTNLRSRSPIRQRRPV